MAEPTTYGFLTAKRDDVIQIVPEHKWAKCLAVVESVKPWGVQAYVRMPITGTAVGAEVGDFYIRLYWDEFRFLNAKVFFPQGEP